MPAVVLFSIVVGVALIAVPDKARAARGARRHRHGGRRKATRFIVALTPYGLFAIARRRGRHARASRSSQRLQVYLVSYVGVSLLLSLWVLPGLVAALTPVPYRAVLSSTTRRAWSRRS